jgi:hypothetical protein
MSSQKSDGIVKRRAPKPRSKPIEVADDFEGGYEDFTILAESLRAQWVTAKALHVAIKHSDALPPQEQATSDRHDMQLILHYGYPTFAELFRIIDSQSEVPGI